MNFASSHVYLYDESDEECVSDDEFEAKTTLSDSSGDEEDAGERGATEATPQMACAFGAAAPHMPAALPDGSGGGGGRGGGGRGGVRKSKGSFLGSLFGSRSESADCAPLSAKAAKKKKTALKERRWKTEAKQAIYPGGCIPPPGPGGCVPPPLPNPNPKEGDKRWRRADTNVMSIQLEELVSPSNMHTGDFVRCHGCKGVISHVSKLKDEGDDKVWECDFCGAINVVEVVEEEIPKLDDVTYMLAPAPTTTASAKSGKDESLVIFCMDTSGSMCVTTEVAGRIALRGDRTKKLQALNDTGENQWMPGQRRNVTFVSRLQSTQAAVDHQLETMAKEHPDRRVALVTFNTSVKFIGDGLQEEKVLSGDKLKDQEQVTACAKEITMPDSVKKSRETLGNKLFDLEEKGQTALGPALLLSVVMACRQSASKVIICTDGMANVGLGSLDTKTEEQSEASAKFYTDVANMALENGVSVSVITIEGTDCKLAELGRVADITGGQVNIVKPENLTKEFGTILADPIIATNVKAVFTVHNQLYIRDADDASESNWVERTVGNVTADTEITFEFGVRHGAKGKPGKEAKSKGKGAKAKSTDTSQEEKKPAEGATGDGATSEATSGTSESPTELPFQIQVTYTDLEGARAMRVLTQKKPVTKERQEAEKNVNYNILGTNACHQSARLAQQGKYKEARLNVMMNQRFFYRKKVSAGDDAAKQAYGHYINNTASLVEAAGTEESEEKPNIYREIAVRPTMSDVSAEAIYSAKRIPSKGFQSRPSRKDGSRDDLA